MVTPVIPTLGSQTFITNPPDILVNLLRYFVSSPRSISNTYYDLMISLQDILSVFSNDPNSVAQPITTALQTSVNNIFAGTGQANVVVTTSAVTETTYTITILIQVFIGSAVYSISPNITVVNGAIILPTDLISRTNVVTL